MNLVDDQVKQFRRAGYLLVESIFGIAEVEALRNSYERDARIAGEHSVMEETGQSIRSLYASHRREPLFQRLVSDARLLAPARQLLDGSDVYVYQFKTNAKAPFTGSSWSWHQDYMAWKISDNLNRPSLINVAIFLDEITEFNGPIVFLPGSHDRDAMNLDSPSIGVSDGHIDPEQIAISAEALSRLVKKFGMEAPKAPSGAVLFFSPTMFMARDRTFHRLIVGCSSSLTMM